MQKKIFQPDEFRIKKEKTIRSSEPTLNWWETVLHQIKSNWKFWKNNKTKHLQKRKPTTKIVPFTQPTYKIEIKGLTFNTSLEPSIDVFLFVKETSTIQIYLRDVSKKTFHHSSHLVHQGEQDFSIILKNGSNFPEYFFIQIKEVSGKTQTQKISI